MKIILTIMGLILFNTLSIAQTQKDTFGKEILRNKSDLLPLYLPSFNKKLSFQAYNLSVKEFIKGAEKFKKQLHKIARHQGYDSLEFRLADADYYIKNLIQDYKLQYGWDSISFYRLSEFVKIDRTTPNYRTTFDSLARAAFPKKLTATENEKLNTLLFGKADPNNENLFKKSESYRTWVENYVRHIRNTRYKADTLGGYKGNDIVKLKAIRSDINNTFIKEYLIYQQTIRIMKMSDDDVVIKKIYADFFSDVSNKDYLSEVKNIYDNYVQMNSNGPSPLFAYYDIHNKLIRLEDLKGKYVYIDVWATWCGPCKMEIPYLQKIEEEFHHKNIHFVSLSVDKEKDKDKWKKFVVDSKLGGIQVMADNDFSSDFIKKYNINAIPRFILIDPEGNTVDANAKRPSDPALRKQLAELLD